jgi:translocation and assembly module TamA
MLLSIPTSSLIRSADSARLRGCLHIWARLASLVWCACAPAYAAPAAKYAVEIVAPRALEKVLQDNLDIVRWSKREDVTPGQVEQLYKTAPDQIAELLATEGYFSAHVEASFERQKQPELIRFVVDPGEPARIASIDLRVVGPVTTDAQASKRITEARAAFTFKVGDSFQQNVWKQGKDAVVHSLARRVYAAARVSSSRVQIHPETHSAQVQLEVDSGPPFTFGALKVNGLSRYAASIVTNLNPIRPGDPYDEDELVKFQRRLLSTGYFASAIVAARPPGGSARSTPVTVNLVESPSQRVELGAGLSTDRGPRAQIDYNDHNLLDRAWRLSSSIYADRLSQSLTAGLQFPRNERGYHYGLEAKFKNEDIQGQRVTDWSTTGAHTYFVEEYASTQALQFLAERSSLVGGTVDNRQALYLSQTWTWNGLDDVINPRRGYLASLQVGGASEGLASTRSFGRIQLKAAYLQPLGERWTLGLRADTGFVLADSRDGIPSAYVFRAGGDNTIRGYAFESLGVSEGGAIVGGRYMLVGSVELTRWITREWGAAVFYDTGNAFDDWHDFNPVNGYGAGVRWRSPLGALSLDLAYGEAAKTFRVHFSAGFAFR